jgi:ZIP family zinc transporter
MTAVFLAIGAFFSTLVGGTFALKNADRLHRILGFTSGVLLGVVAFDLLPEIFKTVAGHNAVITRSMLALVIGFLVFHIVEKSILIHHAQEKDYGAHHHPQVGLASAIALSGHSFLDGVGIGLGFQVNAATGIAVAIAVLAHDFTDGLNTVSLMLVNKNTSKRSVIMLLVDAAAPVLGALATLFFHLSSEGLVLYLGFFAGFLLYIGASEILPEAHAKHSSYWTILLTIFGAAVMFAVTRFV